MQEQLAATKARLAALDLREPSKEERVERERQATEQTQGLKLGNRFGSELEEAKKRILGLRR